MESKSRRDGRLSISRSQDHAYIPWPSLLYPHNYSISERLGQG
jgi:hypothetical protein